MVGGGAVAVAGCLGGSDDGGDGSSADDDDEDDEEDPFDDGDDGDDPFANDDDEDDPFGEAGDVWEDFACGDLRGEPVAYDPAHPGLLFTFDYPDTWEEIDREGAAETRSPRADFGHSATLGTLGIPAYALEIEQSPDPEPEDPAETYWSPDGRADTRTFDFGGEEATAVRWNDDGGDPIGGDGHVWWVSIPGDDGWYRTTVECYRPYGGDADEPAERHCDDDLVAVSTALVDSIRPRN